MDDNNDAPKTKAEKALDILKGPPAGIGKTAYAKVMAKQISGNPKGYTGPVTVSAEDLTKDEGLSDIFKKAAKNGQTIIFTDADKIGETELIKAAMSGDIDRAGRALDNGENINHMDFRHGSALHIAARLGHRKLCGFLIDKGIDIHQEITLSGHTAFHSALAAEREDMAVYLAMRGGKIEPPHGGLLAHPAVRHTPNAAAPKDEKFSPEALERIRAKVSETQAKHTKNIALRRKRGHKNQK